MQAPDGAWTPAEPVVLYAGPADVQDSGPALRRAEDGTPTQASDADAFLADWRRSHGIRPGDDAVVGWGDGEESAATVVGVRRLDGRVALRWIE